MSDAVKLRTVAAKPKASSSSRVADEVLAKLERRMRDCALLPSGRYTGQATGQTNMAAGVDRVLCDRGRPLDSVLRQDIERRFGRDFSRVSVHSGAVAEQSSKDVSANAYLPGSDIRFGQGQLVPRTHTPATVQTPRIWTLQDSVSNAAVARLISARRRATTEGVISVSSVIQQRIENERSGGRPLDKEMRSEMQSILGIQLSGVRLHDGKSVARLARDLDATAFTQGRDVFLGEGSRTETLAHELTHAAQARTGPGTVQREPAHMREQVVTRSEVAERSRTVAKITIIGHASPRWRGAPTPKIADEKNWRLAEQRADRTRIEVETLLTHLLPDHELVFEYRFKRATEMERDEPVEALGERADVELEVEGRGSSETFVEAGSRGRKANDDPMRRVDVKVTLHSETETDVEEDIVRTKRKSGATTDWSIWVTGEAGVDLGAKFGAILIQLRNNKTRTVGTYAGWTGGIGVSLGVNVAKTSPPDFESFVTREPMSFADFSGAQFWITSVGAAIGVFGAEFSIFRFDRFPGGQPTPGGIQVGGLSFGGIELNLGSTVHGAMFLTDHPSEMYNETTRAKRVQTFKSLSQEVSGHRVLFATGSQDVEAWESDILNEYLHSIVVRSGL